jgi:hypothetical protein
MTPLRAKLSENEVRYLHNQNRGTAQHAAISVSAKTGFYS